MTRSIKLWPLLLLGLFSGAAIAADNAANDAERGNYPNPAEDPVARMPNTERVAFEGIGHRPPIEAPKRFRSALFKRLDTPSSESHD